jgi:hypothetical protein
MPCRGIEMHTPTQRPVILFRAPDRHYKAELEAAKLWFDVYEQRCQIPKNRFVIGRYSVLPFYKELEKDLEWNGSRLVNTVAGHRYIADLQNWYEHLGPSLTPRTWTRLEEVPDVGGPFVVKGETNSRKDKWNKLMFAETKRDAIEIVGELSGDSLLMNQSVYVREFVPLKTFMVSPINGQPITEEYRFFCLDGKVVCGGYYWSDFAEDVRELGVNINPDNVPRSFLTNVLDKLDQRARFVVVDVARTASGGWIVVELNDGQMSGLSEIDPDMFYKALHDSVTTSNR